MTDGALYGRKIHVTTSIRCDYDRTIIPKGKYALQIHGDPKEVKAQGIFHNRLCYESALHDYEEKLDQLGAQEEGNE